MSIDGRHNDRADAMDLWHGGHEQVQQMRTREWIEAYERVITAALAQLQPLYSFNALLVTYYDNDLLGERMHEHIEHEHERSGLILNFGLVEDSAFWQRYQQLLAAHMQGRTPPVDGVDYYRETEDGRAICVTRQLLGGAIITIGPAGASTYDEQWMYDTTVGGFERALKAAIRWDPTEQREPQGWIRTTYGVARGRYRRRPLGDAAHEYESD